MDKLLTLTEVADLLSVSKETLRRWDKNGKLKPVRLPSSHRRYAKESLRQFDTANFLFDTTVENDNDYIPLQEYSVLELFAGCGGLALGLEKAGLQCQLLNEIDHWACATLRKNRPEWNVVEGDVSKLSFSEYRDKIDVVTGGFPCQAFSYAGKKLGLEDARGTLFYEFARAVQEVQPLVCIAENVRGLRTHEGGSTLKNMVAVLEDIGYEVLPPQLLKAIFHNVPQKRERLFLVGIQRGSGIQFDYPKAKTTIHTVRDALKAGNLFKTDVPVSAGQSYPARKKAIMAMVPPGGYWRNLPIDIQKEYMLKSFYLGGGKTGMARRMSWDEPCLTLTTSPAQKQTERCHPEETRPFTTREYARIQTFPDDWIFEGSTTQVYKQIGNAVPVNLAQAMGKQLIKALNAYSIRDELKQRAVKKYQLKLKPTDA